VQDGVFADVEHEQILHWLPLSILDFPFCAIVLFQLAASGCIDPTTMRG